MKFVIGDVLASDKNEATFERIENITQPHEASENLFVWGPTETGKSAIATARISEKDLLSTRRAMITHPQELVLALTTLFEQSTDYLDKLGTTDVLIIDSFDKAFEGDHQELAQQAITLLIQNRLEVLGDKGDTIIVAQHEPTFYHNSNLAALLSKFENLEVYPLTHEEKICIFKHLEETVNADNNNPSHFSDDAFEFFASGEGGALGIAKRGAEAILKSSYFDAGSLITKQMILDSNK